jgi:hypothetical protein
MYKAWFVMLEILGTVQYRSPIRKLLHAAMVILPRRNGTSTSSSVVNLIETNNTKRNI